MANRIHWNINDVSAGPGYDLTESGMMHIDLPDEKTMEYMEALIKLGFTPTMEIV